MLGGSGMLDLLGVEHRCGGPRGRKQGQLCVSFGTGTLDQHSGFRVELSVFGKTKMLRFDCIFFKIAFCFFLNLGSKFYSIRFVTSRTAMHQSLSARI